MKDYVWPVAFFIGNAVMSIVNHYNGNPWLSGWACGIACMFAAYIGGTLYTDIEWKLKEKSK